MPDKKIILWIFLAIPLTFIGCSKNKIDYESKIKRQRFEKDKHFKYSDNSPLTEKQQKSFRSLDYFPVKKQYRVSATIKKPDQQDTISMAYTNGEEKTYTQYASLQFKLKDKNLSLNAYKNLDNDKGSANQLFIPFYDHTNGHSTYGGGRYLDIDSLGGGDTTLVDFNKAYNPYCAYNKNYACPVPPEENKLGVAIKAGEKNFD